jgi:HPt (histidine-containing phosphotransfer) domain-containing protein
MRSMGYKRPIVALTANAVIGQSDKFLKNGFDDFISKPIDIRQLNNVLNKLIRDKQPREVVTAARLKTSVSEEKTVIDKTMDSIFPRLVEIFIRDASKSASLLEEIINKPDALEGDNLQTYIIKVHSMKGALGIIGEMELSSFASKLEKAGREKDFAVISADSHVFLDKLKALIEKLKQGKEKDNSGQTAEQETEYLHGKLKTLIEACSNLDKKTAKNAIKELNEKKWPGKTQEMLEAVSGHLLHSEFDKAADIAQEIIKTSG